VRLLPGNPMMYTSRAAVMLQLGRFDEAREDALTAMRLGPEGWTMPLYLLGNDAFISGDIDSALEYYSQIVERRPGDWFPLTFRGSIYFSQGEYELARDDLEQSIELEPNANFPYALLVLISLREGQMDEVGELSETVLAKFPDPAFGLRIMKNIFPVEEDSPLVIAPLFSAFGNVVLGQFVDALQDIDTALAIDSSLPELYMLQGFAHCNLQNYEAAVDSYSQGLEIDPDFTLLYLLRAEVYSYLNQMANAIMDIGAVRTSDQADIFAPLLDAAASGDVTCETFFEELP